MAKTAAEAQKDQGEHQLLLRPCKKKKGYSLKGVNQQYMDFINQVRFCSRFILIWIALGMNVTLLKVLRVMCYNRERVKISKQMNFTNRVGLMCKVELNKNILFGTCSIVCLLFSAAGYDDAVSVVNFWYCGVGGMNDGMMCHFSTCICVGNCQFLFESTCGCQVLSKARKTGSSAPDKT